MNGNISHVHEPEDSCNRIHTTCGAGTTGYPKQNDELRPLSHTMHKN